MLERRTVGDLCQACHLAAMAVVITRLLCGGYDPYSVFAFASMTGAAAVAVPRPRLPVPRGGNTPSGRACTLPSLRLEHARGWTSMPSGRRHPDAPGAST